MAEEQWQFVRRGTLERRYWPDTLEHLGALAHDYFHAPLVRRIALSPDITTPFSAGARFRNLLGQCLDELLVPDSATLRIFTEPERPCVYLCLLDEQLATHPDREEILRVELDACGRAGIAIVPVSLGPFSTSAYPSPD